MIKGFVPIGTQCNETKEIQILVRKISPYDFPFLASVSTCTCQQYGSIVWAISCFPLAIRLLCFHFSCLTESPRWLIQHKKIGQAAKIINYIAKVNRRPPPDLRDLELIYKQEGETEIRKRNYNFLSIFQSWNLTRNTFVMVYLW